MYYGNDMLEQFKYTGNQQNKKFLNVSVGTITSVDPDSYTAKVMLEPIGVETEWLPLGTMYAGNNFGLLALPDIGIEVLVIFEMGDIKCGKIICCNFNNIDKPPAVNPGELVMLHKSGSFLRFNTDGSIEVSPDTVLKLAGGGAGLARKGDEVQVSIPNVGVCTGTITSGSSKVQSG